MARMKRFLVFLGFLLCAFVAIRFAPQADAQFSAPALPGTFTDISTPGTKPPSGATSVYTKGGTVCSLDASGNEKCTGSGGGGVTFAAPYVTSGSSVFGASWALTQPALTGWTQVGTPTGFDTTNGYVYTNEAAQGGVQFAGATRPIPGTAPWTVYLAASGNAGLSTTASLCTGANECGISFGFSDGTKYVTTIVGVVASNCALYVTRLTNLTTIAGSPYSAGGDACQYTSSGEKFWRLRDDGTNLTFSYALDGASSASHWTQFYSEAETAFLTAAPTVVFLGNYTNKAPSAAAFLSYGTSTP